MRPIALAVLLIAVLTSTMGTSSALLPRRAAPSFAGEAVINGDFIKRSLDNYKGKYLVLLFYPFDFTFVCPTELTAFSDAIPKFDELNAEVLGVSTDSKFTHLAWLNTPRNKGGVESLKFPLFADVSKDVSRDFGVLVEDKEDELYGAALRGLYIIDGAGTIRHSQVTDAPVGRNADEVLRLIEAFQFVDKNGEVCPHGWHKGANTIKPTPSEKGEYFQATFGL